MKELFQLSKEDQAQYFQEAIGHSENIKNPIIIEKNLWVCWTLDQIFSSPTLPLKGARLSQSAIA